MRGEPWNDAENDLIVGAYVSMLRKDIAGESLVKADYHRHLAARTGRSRGSVEFKLQNVSFVMQAMGEPTVRGYAPARNVQHSLKDAVARRLAIAPDLLAFHPVTSTQTRPLNGGFAEDGATWLGPEIAELCEMTPPPSHRNEPPPVDLQESLAIAVQYDAAGREMRNRRLGRAGEAYAFANEKARLLQAKRPDLANNVRWISEEDGDGAGYDIESFDIDGSPRLLEVKTTNGWERTPFHISRNELAVADARRDCWVLFRLFEFVRRPKAFELRPPLESHVKLSPTSFAASFS